MRIPIGIDLGTTYSAIAKWVNSAILTTGPNCYTCPQEGQSQYSMASKIFISKQNGEIKNVLCGSLAIKKGMIDPDNYYSAFKRGMDDNAPIVRPNGKITPVELSSLLLQFLLQKCAQIVEGKDFIPEGVVVSVPYYFTEPSCQNTRTALSKAIEKLGYESSVNLQTVAEPIAAGLDYAFTNSYNIGKTTAGKENILIFDLGGGTFDVTIYQILNDEQHKLLSFTVMATDGDSRLGGEDFDASIRKFILEKNGIDESTANDPKYKNCLVELCRQITEEKCALSFCDDRSITMTPFFNQKELEFVLTAKNINEIMKGEKGANIDFLSKIDDILERCIINSGVKPMEINRIVLVGGSSKIPCVRKLLENKFGKGKMYESDRPSETVARGAAIWAAYLLDKAHEKDKDYKKHLDKWEEITIKEKTAHSLGVLTANNKIDNIIASNIFTPVRATRSYIPSRLTDDGTKAILDPLTVCQGRNKIGKIPFPTIYTHGRDRQSINITITLIAESTSVQVIIQVPEGNEDGSDIHTKGQIQIA